MLKLILILNRLHCREVGHKAFGGLVAGILEAVNFFENALANLIFV